MMTNIKINEERVSNFGVYLVYTTSESHEWTDESPSINICYDEDDFYELGFSEVPVVTVGETLDYDSPAIDYVGVYITRIY